jgi:hypothetical protein
MIPCAYCGEREAVVMLGNGNGHLIAACGPCEALPEDDPLEDPMQSGLVAAAIIASAMQGRTEVN